MADDFSTQAFREEAYELLGELENALLELEENPKDQEEIDRVFRAMHTIKGSGSMFGFDDIAAFTHEVETVFDMVRNGEVSISRELLDLVLLARDRILDMLNGSESGEDTDPEQSQSIVDGLKRVVASDDQPEDVPSTEQIAPDPDFDAEGDYKKLGEILVERGSVKDEDIATALAEQQPLGKILANAGIVSEDEVKAALAEQNKVKEIRDTKRKREQASSIRVASDKLDTLVNLVGELVIVQARISQVVGERTDPVLTALSEDLERLSDELRDSTLGIRMLPIGTTFSKFKRLVRDLSGELGKKINLVTSGAETELDKTVIEQLNDPLVHLLRNSIDHGIEIPEVRTSDGKEETGTISLEAEHSGGEVLIRIIDDGKGMDPEVIRAKAIERGLISPDMELKDKEIFNLVFQPGFSTAEKVTSVSGRGVGMDVVKRSIDNLRGSISIDSQKGKGSTITVKLPLTLAIIDGLQIQVGGEFFVIPLSLVEECIELARSEREDGDLREHEIVDLRGEIVPYIKLRHWFDVQGEMPPIEQIVITRLGDDRVGIVVDKVIGEHQTVIKSLGRVYRDVDGISGATIKGDGSMALILDVPRLVQVVVARGRR